ncbi:hypothetical protein [Peribacillus muralis]|uniref:hypothetical protein n=1 Tax=Peribacillus muralis TaxID=264697 RepID=UPI003D02001B
MKNNIDLFDNSGNQATQNTSYFTQEHKQMTEYTIVLNYHNGDFECSIETDYSFKSDSQKNAMKYAEKIVEEISSFIETPYYDKRKDEMVTSMKKTTIPIKLSLLTIDFMMKKRLLFTYLIIKWKNSISMGKSCLLC